MNCRKLQDCPSGYDCYNGECISKDEDIRLPAKLVMLYVHDSIDEDTFRKLLSMEMSEDPELRNLSRKTIQNLVDENAKK